MCKLYIIHAKRFVTRHWLTPLGRQTSPRICRMSQHVGDSGELSIFPNQSLTGCRSRKSQFQSAQTQKANSPAQRLWHRRDFLLGRGQPFVLLRRSTDWMRPTHRGPAMGFTQSTDLNVNLIQQALTETPIIMCDPGVQSI